MRKTKTIGTLLAIALSIQGLAIAQTEKRTVMNPTVVTKLPKAVRETSGMAFHDGKIYTHNDSGNEPVIFVIDTATYQITQKIKIKNAKNHDWEDICCDGTNLYVGDIGNNNGNRDNLRIYIVPLAEIPDSSNVEVMADKIRFYYADQTVFDYKRHQHDYDCEALMATDNYLYLFSKGWATGTSRIYRLTKKPGRQVAQAVDWFNPDGLVTSADYDSENRQIALVGYVKGIWEPFVYVINNFDENNVSAEQGIRIALPNLIGSQTEGVCRYGANKYYISSETNKISKATLFRIDISRFSSTGKKNIRE